MKNRKEKRGESAGRFTIHQVIIVTLAFLVVGVGVIFATAHEANPFKVAGEHAAMAAQVKDLSMIHEHLHHVLNCLEGPSGKDFDASAGNPCAGSKGALQTLPEDSAEYARVQKAIALARIGVKLDDEPAAHHVAQAVHAILTEGQKG